MKCSSKRPICEPKYKPTYEDNDENHHIWLPQDNMVCSRGGGGGIIQLFIENGGIST